MALKTFLLRKGAPFSVTSSAMRSTPMTRETRMQLAMAAMGIITELVRKSKKSKNPYIGGIIMGILACVVSVTNTLTLG